MRPPITTDMGASLDAARWLDVGRSDVADAETAGAEAAAAALAGRDDACLLVAFVSEDRDHAALLRGIASVAPGVPLIGGATGPDADAVVLAAFGGPGFSSSTTVVPGADADPRGAGSEAAACVGDVADREHRVLIVFACGDGDPQELVRGAYSVAGSGIPLVGGCTAAPGFGGGVQLHGTEALRGAVVGAALGSDTPFGVGIRHGWQTEGEPMLVTRASGTVIMELDGRPALDAYLERAGAPADIAGDRDRILAFSVTHPFGLRRRASEPHVRAPIDVDLDRRTVSFTGSVAQGGLVWTLSSDRAALLDAGADAATSAVGGLGGAPSLGLLAFSCAARHDVLGADGAAEEERRLTGHGPVAGLATAGELGRIRGLAGYHNHTLVVLAVS